MAEPLVFADVRGMNLADAPTRLLPGLVSLAYQVLLEPRSLGRRRPSAVDVSLTSGPSDTIRQLARFQPSTASAAQLIACSGTSTVHRLSAGTWSTISTPTDAIEAFATYRPQMVTHNGKLFLACKAGVNRLHVYDPGFSTSDWRRVGIDVSGAPTAADTGSGSYPDTTRYYKIQWKIINSGDTVATSELSAALEAKPSGTGTAMRVTKPTTPDSATHWVVFGSADSVTYYNLSGNIAVGTTTYDDSALPSAYAAGAVAPSTGLYIPPPAAKYLLSDGSRLLMAGAWESDSTAGRTPTKPVGQSRVWFTFRTGALDNTGEDEAIANSVTFKNWVDCGEQDGDSITGLGGPINGIVFVFKQRSLWALMPTGNELNPYRPERISPAIGATWQDGIAVAEDAAGNPAIYFMSLTGPKRLTPGRGIEDIGADLRVPTQTTFSGVASQPIVVWDQVRRVLWWLTPDGNQLYAYQPQFEFSDEIGELHGGWTLHNITGTNYAGTLYDPVGTFVPYFGGGTLGVATLLSLFSDGIGEMIDSLAPVVRSGILQPQGPLRELSYENPILEYAYAGESTPHSVTLASVIRGPLASVLSQTQASLGGTYSNAEVVQEKLESLAFADVLGLQITVTWANAGTSVRPRIHSVTVPVRGGERT